MTFRELAKRISNNSSNLQQQTHCFDILQDKPFWIWNVDEHKQVDVRTNGDCCFNHIIGLPQKNAVDKPLYDYEKMIFDSLVLHGGNSDPSNNKHLRIKQNGEAYAYAEIITSLLKLADSH